MLSLLILSHSRDIAIGVKNLAAEMNPDAVIHAVGGTKDGALGSDYDLTKETLETAVKQGPVIILFDLGSTLMTVQMVIEDLTEEQRSQVHLCDAALLEGAIVAAVSLGPNTAPDFILKELKKLSLNKF